MIKSIHHEVELERRWRENSGQANRNLTKLCLRVSLMNTSTTNSCSEVSVANVAEVWSEENV